MLCSWSPSSDAASSANSLFNTIKLYMADNLTAYQAAGELSKSYLLAVSVHHLLALSLALVDQGYVKASPWHHPDLPKFLFVSLGGDFDALEDSKKGQRIRVSNLLSFLEKQFTFKDPSVVCLIWC